MGFSVDLDLSGAGKLAHRLVDQPAVVRGFELCADDLAGQVNGQGSAAIGQLLKGGQGGRLDLLHGPLPLDAGFFTGLFQELLADFFRIATALFNQAADLVLGGRKFLLVVGQELPGFLVLALGLGDLVGDLVLAVLQALTDWPPGRLVKDGQHHEENNGTPNRQIAREVVALGGNRIEFVAAASATFSR